ncbi:hypothetical protein [Nocardia cyriacigeorgica]|uniref:hypothetical protein n=1 Tax=Nocardia cyriacigeorgica TaxID=135487 RepID=UPI00245778C3|nr:hypothetical protein [Nocardia cyriacigeorgica]
MNPNTIRAIGIGAAAGVLTGAGVVGAVAAYDEVLLPLHERWSRRRYLTAAERQELEQAQARRRARTDEYNERRLREQAEKVAKIAPGLLSQAYPNTSVAELSGQQLLAEFRHARRQLRRVRAEQGLGADIEIEPMPVWPYRDHLEGLRAEYKRRVDGGRAILARPERRLLDNAWWEVCDHSADLLPLPA